MNMLIKSTNKKNNDPEWKFKWFFQFLMSDIKKKVVFLSGYTY